MDSIRDLCNVIAQISGTLVGKLGNPTGSVRDSDPSSVFVETAHAETWPLRFLSPFSFTVCMICSWNLPYFYIPSEEREKTNKDKAFIRALVRWVAKRLDRVA